MISLRIGKPVTFTVNITTAADGSATAYTPRLSGRLYQISYIKTDFTDGVDFTITAEATGETLWTEANVNASKVCFPRGATHSNVGTAALYAAAGEAVNDHVRLGSDRVKIEVASGGAQKAGTFLVTVEDCTTFWPRYSTSHVEPIGEGGGAPEWVPENAKIHIDFMNDRAWTEADGEVAIDTLVGSRAVAPMDEFDPEDITEDGLGCFNDSGYACPQGTFLTELQTNDWTAVIQWKHSGDQGANPRPLLQVMNEADGDRGIEPQVKSTLFDNKVRCRDFDANGPQSSGAADTAGGTNLLALTFTSTKIAISLNGEATQSTSDPYLWGTGWDVYTLGRQGSFALMGYVMSFTLYDEQSDEDLPGLSTP